MSESLFDPEWYRVADVRPRLRSHVRILRHHYRGRLWYVVQDAGSGRFHRFTPEAYEVIGHLDGERTLQEIWHAAAERLGDDVPTQRETIRLLHHLHSADVLQADIRPDIEELMRRHDRHQRQKWLQYLRSPMAVRVPLIDPEAFLRLFAGVGDILFSRLGAILWSLAMLAGAVQILLVWPEFTRDVSDRVLTAQNLVVLALVFPIVKLLHELGHGFAVKRWGGEVHQLGVMFIVFMPIPYVDASASTAFRSKFQRALVGAAGMLVELFVAALAILVWARVEPGLVKAVAYNVVFIASVSTLVFNGNPLLRFDAYYILADLIEIPNLAQRANRYVFYLIQRHVLDLRTDSPVNAPGERAWFVGYAVASFCYRMLVYFGIALFVASSYFIVGVLLALFTTVMTIIVPLLNGARFLLTRPELRGRRLRAWGLVAAVPVLLAAVLLALPAPLFTVAEGTVWLPERALVRTRTDGFVEAVLTPPGTLVTPGEPLVRLVDPLKAAEVRKIAGELAALEAEFRSYQEDDRVRAEIVAEEIRATETRLAQRRSEIDDLVVRAEVAGRFVVRTPEDLPGRFATQGTLLGYVVEPGVAVVRVVVTEAEVDLVRRRLQGVEALRTERLDQPLAARVVREVPSASVELPSVALGKEGGGRIDIDPSDEARRRPLAQVFLFDVALPADAIAPSRLGSRIHVRFDHGFEPIWRRGYRSLRRLFLSTLDV